MPRTQLHQTMDEALGPAWRDRLAEFDEEPMAAASIGQVHRGVLPDGRHVAIKVQYPGVARSIESDVDNLLRLVRMTNILPKGLYVEAAAAVRVDDAWWIAFSWEARNKKRNQDACFLLHSALSRVCMSRHARSDPLRHDHCRAGGKEGAGSRVRLRV